MKYRVVSPRVGTPGEIYEPEAWINLQHLINAGFIEPAEDHAQEDPKPAKTKSKNQPKE